MTEPATEIEQEVPKNKPVKRRKRRAAPRRAAQVVPFKAPTEFAGITPTECCDACKGNRHEMEQAQRRMNEIAMAYPRFPSRDPRSETVLESDAEWLARNPGLTEEWRALARLAAGTCFISGGSGCAHPFKTGLSPQLMRDPVAVARYERAKKVLDGQMVDMRR